MKPGSLGLSVTANGPLRCTYTRFGEPSNFASTRCINPPTLTKPTGYAHVVIAKGPRTIYIAGHTATDKDGNVVGPVDFRAHANQIFENLRAALGAGFDDIVNLNIYVLDMTNAPAMREVRADYLASNPPAATLVEVKKLARDEFMLEIEAIAVTAKKRPIRRATTKSVDGRRKSPKVQTAARVAKVRMRWGRGNGARRTFITSYSKLRIRDEGKSARQACLREKDRI